MIKQKYKNISTVIDGITFQSRKEGKRYSKLLLLARAGKITNLTLQPKYELLAPFKHEGKTIRAIYYVADFRYVQDGEIIVEDVKGFLTDVYKLKKKMFLSLYGEFLTFNEIY